MQSVHKACHPIGLLAHGMQILDWEDAAVVLAFDTSPYMSAACVDADDLSCICCHVTVPGGALASTF